MKIQITINLHGFGDIRSFFISGVFILWPAIAAMANRVLVLLLAALQLAAGGRPNQSGPPPHSALEVAADGTLAKSRTTSMLEKDLDATHAALGKLTMAYEKLSETSNVRKARLEAAGDCGPSNCDECSACPNCC